MASSSKKDDLGQAEKQKIADEQTEKGVFGVKVDPIPDREYSLQSGPESPSAAKSYAAELRARADLLDPKE